jgi:hypothetical protein
MFGLFGYLVFAYLVVQFGKPFHMAGVYAVGGMLFSLLSGADIISVSVSGVFLFAYVALVYFLIDHFNDGIFKPIGVMVGGAVILFLGVAWL